MAKNVKETKNKKHFFKDFKAELKKVIWPTPKQMVNKTIAVVVIVIITAAIVFVLDFVFNLFNDKLVNGLKAKINSKVVVENTIENGTDETDETVVEENNEEVTVENETVVEENNEEVTVENETLEENV